MNNTNILESLQRVIETAEILVQAIPEEAMDDLWLQEIVDTALAELNKTSEFLKDKYDLDMSDFDDVYLSNTEFSEMDETEMLDSLDETDDTYDAFDFEEEDD